MRQKRTVERCLEINMIHPSISVYVSSGAASDRRVNIACELTQKMNAKLVGLGCQSISSKAFPNGPVSNRLLKLEFEHATAELTQREKRFRELAACKTPHLEWRGSNDYPLKAFINKLRSVDLLVIGSDSEAPLEHRFNPATIIMQAGRPILYVPDHVKTVPFRRAIIAWKDGRESRCALANALPFLKITKDILLLGICEEAQTQQEVHEILSDVGSYLLGHEITVEPKVAHSGNYSVAEELLLQAKQYDADVIVAGAYGRSQIGEWIFGGVTEVLLNQPPCACLLSH